MATGPSAEPSAAVERRAGVLLHVTSLPGPYGVGDVGPGARALLAWLEAAGQRIWQVLPVQPPDAHGSPYASPSAFARSPLLMSVDDLVDDGWLRHAEKPWGVSAETRVDHQAVAARKGAALELVARRVVASGVDLSVWTAANPWVEVWARYATLSAAHGPAWTSWPEALRHADPAAVREAVDPDGFARHVALQWLFDQQWARLRAEARARGISLWGDVPIFVGGASADVWAHRHLFRLDDDGAPTVVTGVPPDAFAPEGQTWGTPHYDVAAHAAEGYAWWCQRLGAALALFDEVRIDHFRGLAGVWEIPAGAPATSGRWVESFGAPLLAALRAHLGGLPLIAEDLGVITPDVEALRDDFHLPGMAILQFAFADARSGHHPYLPHHHRAHQVVYPGTHDNPPTNAWYDAADERTRDHLRRYLSSDGRAPAADLARAAWRSVCKDAIVPMQDLLGLGADARMNTPGVEGGNWAWRCGPGALQIALARQLREEAVLTGRAPGWLPRRDGVPSVESPAPEPS